MPRSPSLLVVLFVAACGTVGRAPPDLGASDLAAFDSGDAPDLAAFDSGCAPDESPFACNDPLPDNAGCTGAEDCGGDGSGNGLDDDCNGLVDDTCGCTPGAVERCFPGPPGKHGVGACTDGLQTCEGTEFGHWGACTGAIAPAPESCDQLDNDCDGCPDDGLCCGGVLDCPGPNDPRIQAVAPFTDLTLDGALFYSGPSASWSWKVTGGPCDQLFAKTTGNPPVQSFTLTGADSESATVHFTLSGDYTITLTVVDDQGHTYTCTWVQHVVGPGVRFELCWDHTGPAAQGGADLDLHVHRSGTTTPWFMVGTSLNLDDCDYADCNPDPYFCVNGCLVADWGNAASPIAECQGAPSTESGNNWVADGKGCPNPRLDVDNVKTVGRPENINIDHPSNGDSYRALVHYFGQNGDQTTTPVEEHPIVNVYCGGRLKATYGQAPNTLGPCPGPTCFDRGGGWAMGAMWRVADVAPIVDNNGDTIDCAVTAIHPPMMTSGYYLTTNDLGY